MKIQHIYTVPYKNMIITITLAESNSFWRTYTAQLDETIETLLKDSTTLSVAAHTLYAKLQPLGLVKIKIVDGKTGSGIRLLYEPTEIVAEPKKPRKPK